MEVRERAVGCGREPRKHQGRRRRERSDGHRTSRVVADSERARQRDDGEGAGHTARATDVRQVEEHRLGPVVARPSLRERRDGGRVLRVVRVEHLSARGGARHRPDVELLCTPRHNRRREALADA